MKLVVAMVQPHKLPDVKKALFDADIHKMTVTNVLGCGQQKGFSETYRGVTLKYISKCCLMCWNLPSRKGFKSAG